MTDFYDGSYRYTTTYGTENFVNNDGSYFTVYPDGSWVPYDTSTGTYDGGMVYD